MFSLGIEMKKMFFLNLLCRESGLVDQEVAKHMFKVAWMPALATFSLMLENSDDPQLVELCLKGYRLGIRTASLLQMDLEAESFVTSISRFTLLGTMKEMKQKNIEAIKILLDIA